MNKTSKLFPLITLTLSLLSANAWARDWAKITIPDTHCGDGLEYSIYVDVKSDKKWAFEFMQGGACWDMTTCWGPNWRTWIHPIVELDNFSILTNDDSPLKDHSIVYFPYCTGDVFAGTHKARYFGGSKVYHEGRLNIEKALAKLEELDLVAPEKIEDLVVYGASAGGIGSLLHTKTFDQFLGDNHEARKRVLSDSPGLHWGHDFWEKFTPEQISDFKSAFARALMDVNFDDGLVAPAVRGFCESHSDWDFRFLQSTLDPIMSVVFGGIGPNQHRRNILSSEGLMAHLKGSENCRVWTIDKAVHSFIVLPFASTQSDGLSKNESARDYIFRFLE